MTHALAMTSCLLACRLSSRGVVVFWAEWVVHCTEANMLLNIADYVLDGGHVSVCSGVR